MYRRERELRLARLFPLERKQGVQNAHGEAGARAHARARRQIVKIVYLHAFVYSHVAERAADGGVLYFLPRIHELHLAPRHPRLVAEKRRELPAAYVAIFVYGGGKPRPAVFLEPRGIVRASSEKRDTERSSCDDHRMLFIYEIRVFGK